MLRTLPMTLLPILSPTSASEPSAYVTRRHVDMPRSAAAPLRGSTVCHNSTDGVHPVRCEFVHWFTRFVRHGGQGRRGRLGDCRRPGGRGVE